MAMVIDTQRLAQLLETNERTVYQHVRDGDFPLEPIRIGRKILWSLASVERFLGLEPGALAEALA